jgi:hypothetical protein
MSKLLNTIFGGITAVAAILGILYIVYNLKNEAAGEPHAEATSKKSDIADKVKQADGKCK